MPQSSFSFYPWNHPYRWISYALRGDLANGVRQRKNVKPADSVLTRPGRKLLVAQEDAVARRLPEEQRERTLAECKLAADIAQQAHKCWLAFTIFDGCPASHELGNGWTRHERPSTAEASRVLLGIHIYDRPGVALDCRKGLIPQVAKALRERAAGLIATAEARARRPEGGDAMSRTPFIPDCDRAGGQMNNIYNEIGNAGVDDHWFLERIAALPFPVENSFSPNQRFHKSDGRVRFDVHLWATVDARRSAYPQVAAQLRKMARFIEKQAAIVDKLTEKRASRRKGDAA
jgi:hypothetical protein